MYLCEEHRRLLFEPQLGVATETNEGEKHSKPKAKAAAMPTLTSARYATLDATAQATGSRLSSERSVLPKSLSRRQDTTGRTSHEQRNAVVSRSLDPAGAEPSRRPGPSAGDTGPRGKRDTRVSGEASRERQSKDVRVSHANRPKKTTSRLEVHRQKIPKETTGPGLKARVKLPDRHPSRRSRESDERRSPDEKLAQRPTPADDEQRVDDSGSEGRSATPSVLQLDAEASESYADARGGPHPPGRLAKKTLDMLVKRVRNASSKKFLSVQSSKRLL